METAEIVNAVVSEYRLRYDNAVVLSLELQGSTTGLKRFLMRNHFKADRPEASRPYVSAFTLAVAYFVGGFIPLTPYLIVPRNEVLLGLWWSIGIMVVVLLVFGYVKTCVIRGWRGRKNRIAGVVGGFQMLGIGTL